MSVCVSNGVCNISTRAPALFALRKITDCSLQQRAESISSDLSWGAGLNLSSLSHTHIWWITGLGGGPRRLCFRGHSRQWWRICRVRGICCTQTRTFRNCDGGWSERDIGAPLGSLGVIGSNPSHCQNAETSWESINSRRRCFVPPITARNRRGTSFCIPAQKQNHVCCGPVMQMTGLKSIVWTLIGFKWPIGMIRQGSGHFLMAGNHVMEF